MGTRNAPRPSRDLGDASIRQELSPFELFPTDRQLGQIREYVQLLLRWNQKISLTALTDSLEIVGRHFGESGYAAKLLPVENCRLADVGTGAGFPGLALKIFSPTIQLILIESNKKKCAFLAETVRSLQLTDVEILTDRFEEIRPELVAANIITSRAVGEFRQLLTWSRDALTRRGYAMLWIGAEDSVRVSGIQGWNWQPSVRIPESQRRFILVGRPVREESSII